MSVPYQVFDAEARALLEGLPGRGRSSDWFVAVFSELGLIDTDMTDVARGLGDIEEASGPVLDIWGDLLREPRGGLVEHEYRRVLAGRFVARNAVSVGRVWAGWVALSGTEQGTFTELEPASLLLEAPVSWTPSETFLARAGAVVRKLIGGGCECNAVLYPLQAAQFDGPSGFDTGLFSYTLTVQGA